MEIGDLRITPSGGIKAIFHKKTAENVTIDQFLHLLVLDILIKVWLR